MWPVLLAGVSDATAAALQAPPPPHSYTEQPPCDWCRQELKVGCDAERRAERRAAQLQAVSEPGHPAPLLSPLPSAPLIPRCSACSKLLRASRPSSPTAGPPSLACQTSRAHVIRRPCRLVPCSVRCCSMGLT